LDESPSQIPKSEIFNWTAHSETAQSNLRFRISGFEMGFRPISKFFAGYRHRPI
jgi:hypothetical protein